MPKITPFRYTVQAGWDSAPHLSEKAKAELLEGTPPHLREARSQGVPSLGSGAIYPIPIEDITVAPFAIPAYWPRAYGMDVGWNRTAAVWAAKNPDDGVIYLYAEHYRGQAEPVIHATAIKARGDWIQGCIDPAAGGASQETGRKLADVYRALGLKLIPADNAVEAGIYDMWSGFSTGRIKAFKTLVNLLAEYRKYRRDEKGRVVKEDDHALDSARYVVRTFDKIASVQAPKRATGTSAMQPADTRAGY